jgi:hypothetical protein
MHAFKKAAVKVLNTVLPTRIKNSLLHLSYHLAPTEFERFSHTYCIGPSMVVGLESLAKRGFAPGTIVDVGAYEGGWSETAHLIWPNSKSILIEPNLSKRPKLSAVAAKINGKVHFDLLGSTVAQSVPFHVMETGSSVMSENSSVERTVETRTLATLDSLMLDLEGENNFLRSTCRDTSSRSCAAQQNHSVRSRLYFLKSPSLKSTKAPHCCMT